MQSADRLLDSEGEPNKSFLERSELLCAPKSLRSQPVTEKFLAFLGSITYFIYFHIKQGTPDTSKIPVSKVSESRFYLQAVIRIYHTFTSHLSFHMIFMRPMSAVVHDAELMILQSDALSLMGKKHHLPMSNERGVKVSVIILPFQSMFVGSKLLGGLTRFLWHRMGLL